MDDLLLAEGDLSGDLLNRPLIQVHNFHRVPLMDVSSFVQL